MKFKTWLKTENSFHPDIQGVPTFNVNNGTTASNQVIRTGLQPQVDSHEIQTNQKDELEAINKIDQSIEDAERNLPHSSVESEKIDSFNNLWSKFKSKWEQIKTKQKAPEGAYGNGLGNTLGDTKKLNYHLQNPNAIPEHEPMLPIN